MQGEVSLAFKKLGAWRSKVEGFSQCCDSGTNRTNKNNPAQEVKKFSTDRASRVNAAKVAVTDNALDNRKAPEK